MVDESFMLVSLKGEQSKDLASVMSNKTALAMLEHLADKEYATESEIAKDLGVPLSTVHYNCKALLKSGLVVADEFHYSQKGKEVPHYKLAKKFIIIAPKDESPTSVMQRLKKFLPLSALVVGSAAMVEVVRWALARFGASSSVVANDLMYAAKGAGMVQTADSVVAPASAPLVEDGVRSLAFEAAVATNDTAVMIARQAPEVVAGWSPSPLALGVLIGGLLVVMVLALREFVRKDGNTKK